MGAAAAIVVLASLAGCGGDHSPAAPPTLTGQFEVVGQVTSIISGQPAGSLTVELPGVGATTTSASGQYSISAAPSGVAKLMIHGPGYYPRETFVALGGAGTINADVIPSGEGFDLEYFDYLFRNNGSEPTRRWTREPKFEIWTRVFRCQQAEGSGTCATAVATEERIDAGFENLVRAVIGTDAGPLTGGAVTGAAVATRDHAPGTVVGIGSHAPPGVIAIVLMESEFSSSSWAVWRADSSRHDIVTGVIQIHTSDISRRCAISHEIAHTLGYHHPGGKPGRPSVMGCDGPTDDDRLHGRIMYSRPPGSRTPDADPDGFTLNAQRVGGGGGATTRWVAR